MKKILRLMAKQKRKWRKRRLKRKRWDGEGSSPVLQLVHAGVGRATDAGDLLTLLPVGQLLGDQLCQQGLSDVQQLVQPEHSVLKKPKQKKTTHTQESIASVTSNVLLWRLKLLRKKKFIRSKWLYCYNPVTSKGLYVSCVSRHLTLGFQLKAHPPDCHLLLLQLLHRHAVHFILCGGRRKKKSTQLKLGSNID